MVLTLFNLENSRSFRVLWLANELSVPLTVRNYARIAGKKAEPSMAEDSGYTLGKSPCLLEDDHEGTGEPLRVVESGNCMQYLVERFAPGSKLLPSAKDLRMRTQVIGWIDFSETLMLHALALVYPVWFARPGDEAAVENLQDKGAGNVCKDMDNVEEALSGHGGPFLCGETFTAADIAVAFSCEYVLAKSIGTKRKANAWPLMKQWLRTIEARPAYKQTLQTGAKHDFCLLESTGA